MARFQMKLLDRINWGRPETIERQSGHRFRAGWFDTIDLLTAEVERLDGGVIAIQVDADPSDIRLDGMLRSRARVGFPGVKVSFESKHGPLTYATDAYDHWQANVRAIALGLQALRAVDRYGISSSGEQYRGWSALTAGPAEKTLTVDEARGVLADASGLLTTDLTNSHAVRSAWKQASRRAHPDTGGTADAFRLITAARDVLLAALR